jgi:hypothetical protein
VPPTHKFALNHEARPADIQDVSGARKYCLWSAPIWCAFMLAVVSAGAADTDIKLPSVTADGVTYSNVVIFSKSATHVSISHAGGMASIKAKSLDMITQRKLGFATAEEPKGELSSIAMAPGADPRIREIQERVQRNVEDFIQQVDKKTLYEILALIGILYLFFCYCCMQICRKTSNRAGLLVWVPGLQMIPLLRAAGMSPWLFLLLLIPGVNVIVEIAWCVRICRVRQKNSLLALLLIIPATFPMAFVYLALSGHPRTPDETDTGRIKLGFQAS